MTQAPVTVIGGGLAGCEISWQLARAGIPVTLHEMRPTRSTEAHLTDRLAELVCSNSFRSDNPHNAIGLLHEELRALHSLVLAVGDKHRVPAGDALAVDRDAFATEMTTLISNHPAITVRRDEVTQLPETGDVVIATGPLTSPSLTAELQRWLGQEHLAFYDAIAPIVDADTLDLGVIFAESRWGKGDGADYLNCPMDKPQYEAFVDALLGAEKVAPKDFEKDVHYFPGCLPIEVMAEQGRETLRFGPMKPIGLTDPRTGRRPWAVVQLRKENRAGTAYNLVGFQTRMKYPEQLRVLRTIPGLEQVAFFRFGSVHRNSFIDSPRLLDAALRLRTEPRLRFAGQLTGVEGYVESTACGLFVALALIAERRGLALDGPPPETALGAMMGHLRESYTGRFQPQNVNFGLFPALELRGKKDDRKAAYVARARVAFEEWRTSWMERLV